MSTGAAADSASASPSSSSTSLNSSSAISTEDIVKALECPICLLTCVPPIFQCRNGHIICEDCYPKIELNRICSSCRAPLGKAKIRCLPLEKLVKGAEVPCRNSDDGCTRIIKLEDLKSHELDCKFRSTNFCKEIGVPESCAVVVSTAELCNHLVEHHGAKLVEFDSIVLQQTARLEAPGNLDGHFPPICAKFNGTLFILQTAVAPDKAGIIWCILCIGSSKKANKFMAQLTIHGFDSFAQRNAAKMSWQGSVLGLDSKPTPDDGRTKFQVSMKQMDKYFSRTSKREGLSFLSWKMSFKILDMSANVIDQGRNVRMLPTEVITHESFEVLPLPPPQQQQQSAAEEDELEIHIIDNGEIQLGATTFFVPDFATQLAMMDMEGLDGIPIPE